MGLGTCPSPSRPAGWSRAATRRRACRSACALCWRTQRLGSTWRCWCPRGSLCGSRWGWAGLAGGPKRGQGGSIVPRACMQAGPPAFQLLPGRPAACQCGGAAARPCCPQYDEYVQRMAADSGPSWEDKEQRAIGRCGSRALLLPASAPRWVALRASPGCASVLPDLPSSTPSAAGGPCLTGAYHKWTGARWSACAGLGRHA